MFLVEIARSVGTSISSSHALTLGEARYQPRAIR